MAVVFSDNFNRADEALDASANWLEISGTTAIVSNVAHNSDVALFTTTATAHTAIADMKVTVTMVDAASDGGPVARKHTTAATLTYYELDVYTSNSDLYRYITGTATLIDNDTATLAANSVMELQATGTGATVTFTCSYNGTARHVGITDTNAARIVAAGYAGVHSYTSSDNWDNFSVDDTIVAGGTVRRYSLPLTGMGLI